jgi:adenine phosphoribosyltransferase
MKLEEMIRTVENFPKDGISFKDITTLLKEPQGLVQMVDQMADRFKDVDFDIIVGPEARGFIIGTPLAYKLRKGFVPVRKPGKLPAEVLRYEYELEYGKDILEIHKDAILKGQKVLIVDDLLATGGTINAVVKMIEKLGGEVSAIGFVIELEFLNGREQLKNYRIESLIKY